ncbi:MAG: DNA internalization-related competence protein ComEC/Rec2 [Lawsonibacter sp.]|nr:DNA internalization-related competence protein ComEC/Rec2 [Lawsonibacter sp.]
MRKLAIFSFSFSAAIFAANVLSAGWALLPAGGVLALLCPVLYLGLRRRRRRAGLKLALASAGLALGLVWTAVYTAVFFRPAQALDGRTVELTAAVSDWPQEETHGWSVPVQVDAGRFVKLSAVLYLDGQGAALRPGDRISAIVHCTLGDRTFSGESITYYTAKGIFLRGTAYGRLEVQRPDRVPFRYWAAVLSRELKAGIDAAFPPDTAPLIRALVTGNRDGLTDPFTSSIQRTGLAHTVAVSGMHLGILAALLTALVGRGKRSTALLLLVWVVLFCGVAGNTPSVLRAAVMLVLLHIAPLLDRERDNATALGLALMLLLAWNPFSAAHIGLQLSFGAVTGILLVSTPIQNWLLERLGLDRPAKHWLVRLGQKVPRFLIAVLASTLGASVFTLPLTAFHFQSVSLISPLANLLTLWAVTLLFAGGLALGIVGCFAPALATAAAAPFSALARYLDWVVNGLSRMTLAAVPLDSPYYRVWVVLLCVLIGLTLTTGVRGLRRTLLPGCAAAVTFCLALSLTYLDFQTGTMTVTALNVGQGQSVLLRVGGFVALVDCGGSGPDNAGDLAADYLQGRGLGRLDLLVVTHYHDDHANGVPQLLRRLEVSAAALPEVEADSPLHQEILSAAAERAVEVMWIQTDTLLQLGEACSLQLFAPLGAGTDANELGLAVLARSGEVETLVTGDMPGEIEALLLAHTALPDIELLVAGHHGSRSSTTQALLDVVRPELALISVGEGNLYGHPAQETLERLAVAGADIYRTDLQGTITVRFHP